MGNAYGPEVFRDARHGFFVPANSTDIAAGDAVMLDANDRLAPATLSHMGATRFVGFAIDEWTQQIAIDRYGAVDSYATPASFSGGSEHKLHVLMEQTVFALPVSDTAGSAGDLVYLSTATSGAMIYTLTKQASASSVVAVGRLERAYTGASANDRQRVICMPTTRNSRESDIAYWIENHVDDGLLVAFDETSRASNAVGAAWVGGKYLNVAAGANIDMAACASHATLARIALVYVGTGGTVLAKDTGGVKFTFTQAAAGGTASTVARNSAYWPTFSAGDGVVVGAGVFRSGSANLAASRVVNVRRGLGDIMFRKYISGNPYTSGSPALR